MVGIDPARHCSLCAGTAEARHAPRIIDCKRCNIVIRYLRQHKCGLRAVTIKHPVKLLGYCDAAFEAHVEDSTGLALRGLAAILATDDCNEKPQAIDGRGNLLDYCVRRQRRVV